MNPNDNDPKMLDRDLRDFPVPPPPAGLLEKIQAEIPDAATLAGKTATTGSGPRRWPLRLAATLALAAVGATVAWQVVKSRQGREFDRQAAEFKANRERQTPFAARHLHRRPRRQRPCRRSPGPPTPRRPRPPLLKAFR